MVKLLKSNWKLFLAASLTLGLAPFNPPHLWGKLVWLAGGGAFSGPKPMAIKDWLDLFMHSIPWLLLLISGGLHAFEKLFKSTAKSMR